MVENTADHPMDAEVDRAMQRDVEVGMERDVDNEQTNAEMSVLAEGAYNTFAAMLNFMDDSGNQMVQYPDRSVEVHRAWEAVVKSVVAAHVASKEPVEQVSRFAEVEPTQHESMQEPQTLEYKYTPYAAQTPAQDVE